jgi:hypothetical protein
MGKFFEILSRHPPPPWNAFLVFQKIKETDEKFDKNTKFEI